MKVVTWNVNGIRSVFKAGFLTWLAREDPDILCLQEIKADASELSEEFTQIGGYYAYFNSASKKGYSGVAVYSKIRPISIEYVLGVERFDGEGRMLKIIFENFVLFNLYMPHGGRKKENMEYKLDAYTQLFQVLETIGDREVVIAGDLNIAHTELDLCNAKQNSNNTMFTPAERGLIDALKGHGYIDTFRYLHPDKKSYTWWPYAFEARQRDMGWRIDYIFVSSTLKDLVQDVFTVSGSDHGLCGITLNMSGKFLECAESVNRDFLLTK
jgi:exodeoxyribonuclease III